MEQGEGYADPWPGKQASEYSKIYKEQITKGKSEIFAHKYADLMASKEYTELGCYAEAIEYEKALNEGFSERYASSFAMHLSEYIANYFTNYEETINNKLVILERERLNKMYEHLK
ncbi:MAG: hypothetical protein RBT49_05550 [Bacteroidales bacterium]|jgi:hypothetical protein|nr:hypothetical protein [Bacteroidales bacterium]